MSEWITDTTAAIGWAAVTALGTYLAMVLLTRLAGLRSFSKLSSFDFAVTVAIGSVLATAILTPDPPLVRAAAALACLYGIQSGVAAARRRWPSIHRAVDNRPVLLMEGSRFLEENLRRARVTEDDLRAKLREANVLSLDEVRAVVMESTGDVSVLHGSPGRDVDAWLLQGVRGAG